MVRDGLSGDSPKFQNLLIRIGTLNGGKFIQELGGTQRVKQALSYKVPSFISEPPFLFYFHEAKNTLGYLLMHKRYCFFIRVIN